jgi:probable F420-dependent oxidoreductase
MERVNVLKLGIMLPTPEIGASPNEVREFAIGVEDLGYDQVQINGQTLGMDPAAHQGRETHVPYTHETVFLDPFVAMGYLAGITTRINFMSSVMVLTQRQTVLVAKQAADADALSGGRVRLGVGVGINPVDFAAFGADMSDRGRRIEEQIEVMRALWLQPSVTFKGRFHDLQGVGIRPQPVNGDIPIWIGGEHPAAVERAGRIADGFVRGGSTPPASMPERIATVKEAARRAGRDPESLSFGDALMVTPGSGAEQWRAYAESAQAIGVTHILVGTMRRGFTTAKQHLELAAEVRNALGSVAGVS